LCGIHPDSGALSRTIVRDRRDQAGGTPLLAVISAMMPDR